MSLVRPVLLVGGATSLSRLLGFIRDALIAATIGSGVVADAFFVAFRLPNLFRRILGEGALNPAFVPLQARLRAERDEEAARLFSRQAVSTIGLAVVALAMAGDIAAPNLVAMLAPGFATDPAKFALAVEYARLAFPFVAFAVLSSLMASALNAERRFGSAALAPAIVNVILVGALIAIRLMGTGESDAARLLACAVGLSGAVQTLWLVVALWRCKVGLPLALPRWSPELRRLCLFALPGIVASGATQMAVVAATEVASVLPGAVSWLYYADRLYQLPLGFVAVAMGTVLLPEIARRVRENDSAGESAVVSRACELALLTTLPAAAGLLVLASPIVAVLFEHGAFTPRDTAETARTAACLALALPGAALAKIFAQPLFARERPAAPLIAALAVVVITLVLGDALRPRLGAAGIALAIAVAATTQAISLGVLLMASGIVRPSPALPRRAAGIVAASAVMAGALHIALPHVTPLLAPEHGFALRLGVLLALCVAGACFFGTLVLALGAADIAMLKGAFGQRAKG